MYLMGGNHGPPYVMNYVSQDAQPLIRLAKPHGKHCSKTSRLLTTGVGERALGHHTHLT